MFVQFLPPILKTVEQNINEELNKISGCLKVNKLNTKKIISARKYLKYLLYERY